MSKQKQNKGSEKRSWFKRFNFNAIKDFILSRRIVRRLLVWAKRHSLPGFLGIPIYDIITFLIKETKSIDLFIRANSMAYSFFLSIFPSLMMLFTLLPYVREYILQFIFPNVDERFDTVLKSEIQQFMPGDTGVVISNFIEDLTTNPRVGLLSLGFFLAIFFASNGMLTMMHGFEKSYKRTFKQRKQLRKRLIAIVLTFQLGFLLIASVVLIILGNSLITALSEWIKLDKLTEWSISIVRWIVIVLLFYTVISIIYRYGIPTRRKFKMFSPGATLATIMCISFSVLFGFYVDNFGQYNKLYGSFGTIIVTMIWIQLNSLMLLIGFELNASIAINRDKREEILEKVESR